MKERGTDPSKDSIGDVNLSRSTPPRFRVFFSKVSRLGPRAAIGRGARAIVSRLNKSVRREKWGSCGAVVGQFVNLSMPRLHDHDSSSVVIEASVAFIEPVVKIKEGKRALV